MIPADDFNDRLRRWSIRQAEVAREASVSTAYICDVTHGRRRASRRVLEALDRLERRRQKALGVESV